MEDEASNVVRQITGELMEKPPVEVKRTVTLDPEDPSNQTFSVQVDVVGNKEGQQEIVK